MKQNSAKFKIIDLKNMLNDGTLTWDESIQRCGNVWTPKQKSELIHSILAEYYIPSICMLRSMGYDETQEKDVSYYSILDGKQRLSVIFNYMEDGFKLHKTTPSIKDVDGEEVVLAGKKFSQLPKEIQGDIKKFKFSIVSLEECTPQEVEMMFYRLNNGSPLTKVQQSRALLGGEGAAYVNSLLEMNFFKKCKVTTFQKRREDNLGVIFQSLMLMDESYQWKTLGATEIANYCEHLRDNFSVEMQCEIFNTIKLLSEIFTDENIEANLRYAKKESVVSFLTKINLTSIVHVARELSKYNINVESALMFFDDFFREDSSDLEEFHKYCGDGTVSKAKVNGRNEVMLEAAKASQYFDLSEGNRRYDKTLEEVKPILNEAGFIPREYILG